MPPTTLLRHNSLDDVLEFSAPAGLEATEPACGCAMLGRSWHPRCFRGMATPRTFVGVLAALGLLHGACVGHLAQAAAVAAGSYGYTQDLVDWLQVSSELTQGVLALALAYWGGRAHRPAWIGACVTFQAVTYFLVLLPYLSHGPAAGNSPTLIALSNTTDRLGQPLCGAPRPPLHPTIHEDSCPLLLVLLFLAQVGVGVANTAFLVLGLPYIDDNVERMRSPTSLASAIALKHIGSKIGVLLAWTGVSWNAAGFHLSIFWWLGWPILSTLLLVAAILVSMFPVELPATTVKQVAASILDLARGGTAALPRKDSASQATQKGSGFCATLIRVLTNKIVVVNVLAVMLLQTGIANFTAMEDQYLQSTFRVPMPQQVEGFSDPWTMRLTTSLLQPPLVSLAILVSGLVISWRQPRAGKLAAWNFLLALAVGTTYVAFIFLDCGVVRLRGERYSEVRPVSSCDAHCGCPLDLRFSPVCSGDHRYTYYSACHAGCTKTDNAGNYRDCSCVEWDGGRPAVATEGPCQDASCEVRRTTFRALAVLGAGLLGSGLVARLLLSLRAVEKRDKAVAVALELTMVGLIAYIPGKVYYRLIASSTCIYPTSESGGECKLHNADKLQLYVNIFTACVVFLSAVMDAVLWRLCLNLRLYREDHDFLEGNVMTALRDSDSSYQYPQHKDNTAETHQYEDSSPRTTGEGGDSWCWQSGHDPDQSGAHDYVDYGNGLQSPAATGGDPQHQGDHSNDDVQVSTTSLSAGNVTVSKPSENQVTGDDDPDPDSYEQVEFQPQPVVKTATGLLTSDL